MGDCEGYFLETPFFRISISANTPSYLGSRIVRAAPPLSTRKNRLLLGEYLPGAL